MLPDYVTERFPMKGNVEINTNQENQVRLAKHYLAYLISFNDSIELSEEDWWKMGEGGKYLNGVDKIGKIYRRVITPGKYVLSNLGAMYLFSDDMGNMSDCNFQRNIICKYISTCNFILIIL